ncbi:MAG: hypothetical protein RBQ97_04480 [Acholeplasma sp.]|nr:hypothetical protein [Acholeplasma sp.]
MIKLTSLRKWLYLIFFYPLYLDINGVYKASSSSGNSSEGFVLSWMFVLSGIIILKILYEIFREKKLIILKELISILTLVLIFVFVVVMQSLIGYLFFDTLTIFIINGQLLAAMTGIIVSYYFIIVKKFSFEEIVFSISLLFLFAALSNLIVSIYKLGIQDTFGRNIWPSTFFGGIYHHFIYYPYIVSQVFLFALPLWFKKIKGLAIFIYIFIFIYILVFQVRGAIISYSIGLVIFSVYYLKFNFKYLVCFSFTFLIFLLLIPRNILIGRFFESPIEMLSHRTNFFSTFITNVVSSPSYLLIGSLSKSYLYDIPRNQFSGIFSLHNQYINIFDNYGLPIVIILILILVIYYQLLKNNIRSIKDKITSKLHTYWTLIVLLSLSIDLNINEQLSTANPGIYMFFFWSAILFSTIVHQKSLS